MSSYNDMKLQVNSETLKALTLRELSLLALGVFLIVHSYPNTYFYSGYLAWIALVPLLLVIEGKEIKSIFLINWVFWLTASLIVFHIDAAIISRLKPVTWLALGIMLVYLPTWFASTVTSAMILVKKLPPYVAPLVFAAIWVIFEYLSLHSPAAFPILIGLTQFNQPIMIQFANIAGIFGVSFLIVCFNFAISQAIGAALAEKAFRTATISVLLAISIVSLNMIYGAFSITKTLAEGSKLTVALIQPNISWEKGIFSETNNFVFADVVKDFHGATASAKSRIRPNLIIWPELALDRYVTQEERLLKSAMPSFLGKEKLLFGAPYWLFEEKQRMNSAYLYQAATGITEQYNKTSLVPLYESLQYKAGTERFPLAFDNNNQLGVMICVESVHPEIAQNLTKNGANLLVLISNDSWFSGTNWPLLHAAMLPFRAVENNRWAIHLSNNGPSLVVDNNGHIVQATPFLQGVVAGSEVFWLKGNTFYTRYGDLFTMFCFGVLGIALTYRGGQK